MNRASLLLLAALGAILLIFGGILILRSERGQKQSSIADFRPELALGRTEEYNYDPPAPGTYRLPPLKRAGDGEVLGENGEPKRLRDLLQGRITILSFIYTRCADPTACPYATGVLSDIHKITGQDPAIAKSLRLITFSFDPEYDSPEVMTSYRKQLGMTEMGSEWMFLTTSSAEVAEPILHDYGQTIDVKLDPDDPLGPLNHLLRVYLIDREGMIRNIYSTGLLDPRLVLTDVRTLLMEEEA